MIPYRIKIVAIVCGIIILVLLGVIVIKNNNGQRFSVGSSPILSLSPTGTSQSSDTAPSPAHQQPIIPLDTTYQDNSYHFSFRYPEGFQIVNQTPQGQVGKQLVAAGKNNQGFQLTIMPFDEPVPITKQRILHDIPDMVINNDSVVTINNTIPALTFDSTDQYIGNTANIWFIYKGNIYQLETYQTLKEQLLAILTTWKFQ